MHYDPIKRVIGNIAGKSTVIRRALYTILGVMFLREWYVKRALRQLLEGNKEPFTIFDAGSGFGQYSYYCARRFPHSTILAVDVKEEQIADCVHFFKKMGIRNVAFSVEDLTLPKHREEFDFIFSVDVMEHIPDDQLVFNNFHEALKPGGRVLINTPSDQGGSDVGTPGDTSFIEEHARSGYGIEDIRKKLESAGLKVESIRFTYGPFGNVAWRLGIKYPMMLLNASKAFFIILPFYYLLTFWFTLLLMYGDYISDNSTGTGLLVVAVKEDQQSLCNSTLRQAKKSR